MVGVEFFPIVFVVYKHEVPLMFCLWGDGEGEAHVCLVHSLTKLMMVCISIYVSVHFSGMRGAASCSSLVSHWMLMNFGSLNV